MTVTDSQCRSRHRWLTGILLTIFAITLSAVGGWGTWTASEASDAKEIATEAACEVGEHIAASVPRDKSIDDKLETIQSSQRRLEDKVDTVLSRGGE